MLAKYRALDTAVDFCRALDIIENKRLHLSSIEAFNDPLEARGVSIPIDGYAGVSISLNSEMLPGPIVASIKRHRATCFSSDCRNIQMWTHYAHGFTGMCICLDGASGLGAKKVKYSDMLIDDLYSDFPNSSFELDERVRDALLVKQKGWEYEKEYRIIRQCDTPDDDNYLSFEESNIKAVILGHCAGKSVRERVRKICSDLQIPLYLTHIRNLSNMVGVIPEGFSLDYGGVPIDIQIKNYCNEHRIKSFDELEAECLPLDKGN